MTTKNTPVNPFLITVAIMLLTLFSMHAAPVFVVSLFPIPVLNAYHICNHSARYAFYADLAAVIFYMVTSVITRICDVSDIASIAFLIFPGISIGLCFKKNLSFKETMFFTVLGDCIIFIIALAVMKYALNINITSELRDVIVETFDLQTDILKNVYPEVASAFTKFGFQIFSLMYQALPGLVPIAVLTTFLFLELIRYAFCKIACRGYFITSSSFADGFDTFRVGLTTNIALILAGILMISSSSAKISIAGTNVILFIFILYFITAISNIEYKLKYKIRYPATRFLMIVFIMIAAIILTAIVPVANFVYIFIFFGFMDSLLDFRKLNDNNRR